MFQNQCLYVRRISMRSNLIILFTMIDTCFLHFPTFVCTVLLVYTILPPFLSFQSLYVHQAMMPASKMVAIGAPIAGTTKSSVTPEIASSPSSRLQNSARGKSGGEKAKGPPYYCCVCNKAFNHPPAHASHEKVHVLSGYACFTSWKEPRSYARMSLQCEC